MILDKQACPDCKGEGIDPLRRGLCIKCHGGGMRTLRDDEKPWCTCGKATAICNDSCKG